MRESGGDFLKQEECKGHGDLGQRPTEDHAYGQARLSTAGYARLPLARTDPTFPTPSLCPCSGHRRSPPKACRQPPTPATPAQHTPRLRLETSPWRAIPSASNQEDAAITQRTPGAEPSSPPRSPRVTAPQHGLGGRNQPRTVLSRAAGSGDADTKGTRASPTWSRAVRAPARPLCARLRWPRPVTARGCRCPVSLPRAARPAAQRPLCLPALRPENCARGRRGASAH